MSLETLAPVSTLWQVREDRDFYIPNYVAGERGRSRPELYSAADDHAQDLRVAERHLDDALNLAGTLRAALQEADDIGAMQADTVLKIMERLLNEAHTAIDRHDTLFMNLFMAYFDFKGSTIPSPED